MNVANRDIQQRTSLRGGTTRQSVWDYGKFRRLPQSYLLRNDVLFN